MARVALLRAVNVGGTGRLKMDRLRALAEALGFRDVRTQGASGNLVYASDGTLQDDHGRLAAALEAEMGQAPTIVLRQGRDLRALVEAEPFADAPDAVPDKWRFVAFQQTASKAELELPVTPITLRRPREVCYVMPEADREALDAPKQIEKVLGTPVTVRNWNVVQKLAEMATP